VKVGDLVTYAFQVGRDAGMDVGLIVEIGKWTGLTDVKVLWMGSTQPRIEHRAVLEAISS